MSEVNYLRVKVDIDKNKVTGITRLYIDGSSRKDRKVQL